MMLIANPGVSRIRTASALPTCNRGTDAARTLPDRRPRRANFRSTATRPSLLPYSDTRRTRNSRSSLHIGRAAGRPWRPRRSVISRARRPRPRSSRTRPSATVHEALVSPVVGFLGRGCERCRASAGTGEFRSAVVAGGRLARPARDACRRLLPRVLLGLLARSTLADRVSRLCFAIVVRFFELDAMRVFPFVWSTGDHAGAVVMLRRSVDARLVGWRRLPRAVRPPESRLPAVCEPAGRARTMPGRRGLRRICSRASVRSPRWGPWARPRRRS